MEHHGPTSWLLSLPLLPHDPHYIHINGAIVIFLFVFICSLIANRILKRNPEAHIVPSPRLTLVSAVDVLIEGVYNMIADTLGDQTPKYFPFIASVFLFILFSNLLALLPFSAAPTANISTTFALGLASFVYFNVMGVKEHGFKGYLHHFLMGLGPAGVLVACVEMVSLAIRPLSLALRLYVNMHVDHTLLGAFQNLVAWVVPVPFLIFGIVVSTIQAFVFATLTAVYVQMATEHEH